MTPQTHLKRFRTHFALTVPQASSLLNVTRKEWRSYEQGTAPLPPKFLYRVNRWVTKLLAGVVRTTNWCPRCKKNVRRAWDNGATTCPYCCKCLTRPMRKRIKEVLPIGSPITTTEEKK